MKKIFLIILFIVLCFGFKTNVYAGDMKVYTNYTTITVGSYVTITVNTSQLDGKFSVTSNNTSVLSGGNSSIWLGTENPNKSFSFYANKTGTATISIVPVDVAGLDNNLAYTTTKTITINVIEKSKNNNLSNLKVEGYSMSPTFNKNTLEYTLELENGVTSANIIASVEDKTAYIKGTGKVSLVEGVNTFPITVTAQNGSVKTYTLNIIVKELSPIEVTINGSVYSVIRKKELMPKINEYFKDITIKINDEEVPAYFNESSSITLVGLKNAAGESKLFIYDNGEYKLYEEVSFNKLYIQILNMDENLLGEGYTISKINIGDISTTVYTKEGYSYPVLYGLNLETGEKNLYKYDEKENTLQRMENIVIENNEELYFIIILSLFGFIIISYVMFIIVFVTKNKKIKKQLSKVIDGNSI